MSVEEAIQKYLETLRSVRGHPHALEYDVAKAEIGRAVLEERGMRQSPNAEDMEQWPDPLRFPKTKRVLSKKLRLAVFERDAATCKGCGATDDLSVDHIIAESKGGPDEMDNLQTLCRPCNSRKGTR